MKNIETAEVQIDLIRAGDTVMHDDTMRTVSADNLKRGGFMGTTLFGDSYRNGAQPVIRVVKMGVMDV